MVLRLIFFIVISLLSASAWAEPFLYVANYSSNNVSVIDINSNTVIATIPVGSNPYAVAVNPAEARAYVANGGDNAVSVIDTNMNNIIATMPVGDTPTALAINPSGSRVYVSNFRSYNVSVIDTNTNSVITTIPLVGQLGFLSVNPAGTRLYVACWQNGTVAVIDTNTNAVIATISVGTSPRGVAINPSGTRVYVVNQGSSTVSVIDTSSNVVIATVAVGNNSLFAAVSPSGSLVYVTNQVSNTVSVIDANTNAVVATISVNSPEGVAMNPSGTHVYVANNFNNTVSVIDTNTNTVIATIPVGNSPIGIAVASRSGIKLPQTGQTECYDTTGNVIDCAGTGQDGEIQAGIAWPNPRFADNSDQTITDNLTGLVWAKDGGTPTVGSCTGGAKTWQEALDYVACLNSTNYLGHTDWRLPNINELVSLANNYKESRLDNWLYSQGFSNVRIGDYYWSSTTDSSYSGISAFVMINGVVTSNWKTRSTYLNYNYIVWPVRAGQSGGMIQLPATGQKWSYAAGDDGYLQQGIQWPAQRFTDKGDGAVEDSLTGLIWTKDAKAPGPSVCYPNTNRTWQGALDHVKCLNANGYLGHSDWRLPNINELLSLIDRSQNYPSLPLGHPFINVQSDSNYWSSTPGANNPWFLYMWIGYVNSNLASDNQFVVWPVRGGTVAIQPPAQFELSLVKSGIGSGIVTSNTGTIIWSGSNTGTASYNVGTTVVLTATADIGSIFTGWSGCDSTSSNTCTVLMSAVKSVSATFILNQSSTYTITATAEANGSISPSGTLATNGGANALFTITPDPNYQVLNVIVDGASKGAVTSYAFDNVTANHTINAYFKQITYTITASAGSGGSINPLGTSTLNPGADQTYTITPTAGYHIADVQVDGGSVGAVSTYTFTNVTANHTISATFVPNPAYTITASAGQNGIISPSGAVSALGGTNQQFTITPAAGYRVADLVVDGVSQGALLTSYTFYDVQAGHTISVTFTPDIYIITAAADVNGSITPSGVSTVNKGDSLTLSITPSAGYQVQSVIVDGANKGAATSYAFDNVTANHTINAYFKQITYTITASAGSGGNISPPGTSTVNQGAGKSFTITPAAGYHVADVLVDGSSVGALTTYTFVNITANHTIAATFAANPSYTIAASAGSNGSISPSGSVSALGGTNQAFTITPAAGYRVTDLLVDGASVGALTSYTFANVQAVHTISASFTLDVYTITATADANGSITPLGASTVNKGGSLTFSITPSAGYQVQSVIVDGANKGAITSYTFTNVQANHTINAYFKAITYSLTASAGTNGSITPAGTSTFSPDASQTYSVTPSAGFHVADVIVDGASQGAVGSYTFTNIQANHTIAATFEANSSYTITATASGNGSISPSGPVSVLAGANKKFTFTPQAGYRIADVTVDGASVGVRTSYTFYSVQAVHTINVTYTLDVFTITAAADVHGSISPSEAITVNRGANATFTITPDTGYQVSGVIVDGAQKGAITSYTFTNVTANHTITAYFKPMTYAITASAGSGGNVTPAGTMIVTSGASQTYSITPNAGYYIVDVLVDGVSAGVVSSYAFTNTNAPHTITATFAVIGANAWDTLVWDQGYWL
jgi:YVTN family beta-propeller protein